VRAVVITLLVAAAILALLPPFFTHGTCQAEYEAASDAIERARSRIRTLDSAQTYLKSQALTFHLLSAQQCESFPPPGVEICPGGPTLLVEIPVKNTVCHYYRDNSVHIQLGFNRYLQLVRLQTDMTPYHFLKLPWVGFEVDWAK
jgi:hypothetical protein